MEVYNINYNLKNKTCQYLNYLIEFVYKTIKIKKINIS